MRHFILILGFAGFLACKATAGPVTPETAQQVALNFYFEKHNQYEGPILKSELCPDLQYIHQSEGENCYFVFSFDHGGFVIVSADDRLAPVIGYSFDNDFGIENQPDNVKCLMKQYEDQVRAVRCRNASASDWTRNQWNRYMDKNFDISDISCRSRSVGPLLTTRWNQDFCYNYYCPEDSAGSTTVAGCAAVSIGQVLYYYRWPDHGQGYHCYTPQTFPHYGEQCADFENTW